MIYITGDTHGLIDIEKVNILAKAPIAEKINYFIVLGDFGACFYGHPKPGTNWYHSLERNGLLDEDKRILNIWKSFPWTTLFIDGNHENHDILDSLPIEKWNGGKVHFLADNVIHLMRGQVFNIEGKTFFTMGGAESTDKWCRIPGLSWWAREMPSKEEYEEAIDNLKKYDFKVDYVLTHCAPEGWIARNSYYVYDRSGNELTQFFFHLLNDWKIEFKHWYFGHYHGDEDIQEFDRSGEPRFHLRYQLVQELKE